MVVTHNSINPILLCDGRKSCQLPKKVSIVSLYCYSKQFCFVCGRNNFQQKETAAKVKIRGRKQPAGLLIFQDRILYFSYQ